MEKLAARRHAETIAVIAEGNDRPVPLDSSLLRNRLVRLGLQPEGTTFMVSGNAAGFVSDVDVTFTDTRGKEQNLFVTGDHCAHTPVYVLSTGGYQRGVLTSSRQRVTAFMRLVASELQATRVGLTTT